jgi:hypothetical protein
VEVDATTGRGSVASPSGFGESDGIVSGFWRLKAPADMSLVARFSDIRWQRCCDSVRLHDGADTCGSRSSSFAMPNARFSSASDSLVLHFRTRFANFSRGFNVSFESVKPKTTGRGE